MGTALDLLEWSAPQKTKRKRKQEAKAKKQNRSAAKGEKQKAHINARLYNIIYCRYIYKCSELESMLGNPKKWWALAKKLKVASNGGQQATTSRVHDKDGSVKVGKEALVVWKSYFEGILNESEEVGRQFVSGEEMLTEPEGVLTEDFTMDEVRQALGSLKQRAASERDGLTAEVISKEVLVEFWWVLFNWSWRNGMVPSEWRRGVMVPVPKKKSR